jgi:hypothetical protein
MAAGEVRPGLSAKRAGAGVFRRQVVTLAVAGLVALGFIAWRAGWGVVFGHGWWRW